MSALDDEAAALEDPGSDRRPLTAPGRARKIGRGRRLTVQLRQDARHRQRKLSTRAEARVRRQSPVNLNPRAAFELVVRQKASRKGLSPFGVITMDLDRRSRGGGYEKRRLWCSRTDSAEPSAKRATQIQYAEMQTRWRFHEDGFAIGRRCHDPVAAFGADRTYSVSNAIASASRGPAVFSTITCSRASSLSMKSRGSR